MCKLPSLYGLPRSALEDIMNDHTASIREGADYHMTDFRLHYRLQYDHIYPVV